MSRSDIVKSGAERAPHRSLLKACGYTDEQIRRPFIGIVNSFNEVVPGHVHLNQIARAVKDGVLAAGGTPFEFNTIGVCDGIAMGHEGMHYSLCTRELIADTVECMVKAHAFDALVFIPNCDKIVPGMLMAAMRLNLPSIFVSGGPMLSCRERTSIPRLKRSARTWPATLTRKPSVKSRTRFARPAVRARVCLPPIP